MKKSFLGFTPCSFLMVVIFAVLLAGLVLKHAQFLAMKHRGPAYVSSVQVENRRGQPGIRDRRAPGRPEDEAELVKLAKITAESASIMAKFVHPGTTQSVSLRNEGGNVVYVVRLLDDTGQQFETVVDAGNGSILQLQAMRAPEKYGCPFGWDDDDDAAPEAGRMDGAPGRDKDGR